MKSKGLDFAEMLENQRLVLKTELERFQLDAKILYEKLKVLEKRHSDLAMSSKKQTELLELKKRPSDERTKMPYLNQIHD